MRKSLAAMAVVGALTLGFLATPTPAPAWVSPTTTTGKVTLVHGIPGSGGFPVDLSLYRLAVGTQRFNGVTFGTVAGPLKVPSGIYRLAIRPAGASTSSTPVLSRWFWVGPGSNQSLVAHLSATGSPMLSQFRNDVSATGSGNARVTVRHLAKAPAVDVIANGSLEVISNLSNPNQAKITVPAATYNLRVTDAATNTVTAFQGNVPLAANANTIVYAVGDLGGGSFTPLVQVLPAS